MDTVSQSNGHARTLRPGPQACNQIAGIAEEQIRRAMGYRAEVAVPRADEAAFDGDERPWFDDGGREISYGDSIPCTHDLRVSNPKSEQSGPRWTAADRTLTFNAVHSREFDLREYRLSYLIKRLLVEGQPAALGAPRKNLKTTFAVDLLISLGSKTPFLGAFETYRRMRGHFLSGESGGATIQKTARRICAARDIKLGEVDAYWGEDLPQLANPADMDELVRGIEREQIRIAVIDPLYLCLLAGVQAEDLSAANLFQLGPLLRTIAKRCLDVGCTPVLIHHAKKDVARSLEPMELEDFAYSGCPEFARQWWLLSRRERFEMADDGRAVHRLWLNAGGSVGHGGLWAVDIDEGTLGDDFQGRIWDVKVMTASEAREMDVDAVETKKQTAQERKERADDAAFLGVLDRLDPDRQGLSYYHARDCAKLNTAKMRQVVDRLTQDEVIEEIEIQTTLGKGAKKTVRGIRRRPLLASSGSSGQSQSG